MSEANQPRKVPARRPKVSLSEILAAEPVAAARTAIRSRRQSSGSSDVSQGDVDIAAEALARTRIRPFPRVISAIAGGSLSTVTPMLDDWWDRFTMRVLDPNSQHLDLSARVSMHARLLVAQFEAAIRDQIRDVADPLKALVAAAQLGQHQALQARIAALTQERDHLGTSLIALTHKVAELETQLRETGAARADNASQLIQATERLELALTSATASLGKPATPREVVVEDLLKQVKRLTAAVTRPMRRKRTSRAPVPSRSVRRRPSRRHPHAPATAKGKRLPTSSSGNRRKPSSRKTGKQQ